MSGAEFRRRCMLSFGIEGDKYANFDFGLLYPADSSRIMKVANTPLIPVVAGHSITWQDGTGLSTAFAKALTLALFDSNKVYKTYYEKTGNPRTVNVPSGISYVRMIVDIDNFANAYIKDNTTGEYLWRGSDYAD